MQYDETHQQAILEQCIRQTGISALIAAGLMLLFGYNAFAGGLVGVSNSALYNASVTAYVWTLLLGGAGMLLSAALCFAGLRVALAIDAVFAGLIGFLFLGIGGIQVGFQGLSNLMAVALLVFGFLFIRSAKMSASLYRGSASRGFPVQTPDEPNIADAEEHPDEEGRREAMQRLLARKRQETAEQPEPAAEAPAPTVPVPPEPKAPVQAQSNNEPAPEGFLAELGRPDTERK